MAIKRSVKPRHPAAIAVVALVLVSCSSGNDGTTSADVPAVTDTTDQIATPATAPEATSPPSVDSIDDAAGDSVDDAVDDVAGDSVDPSTTQSVVPSTRVPGPLPVPTIDLIEVGEFDQPVSVTSRNLDGRIFVIEQAGRVVAFDDLSIDTVLDISDRIHADGEQGLLGLAFHPELDLAYVNFTDPDGNTVVAEYQIDSDTAIFDTATFREVFSLLQPSANHNGGNLAFGPDGLLYIGVGDGGAAGDPNRFALELSNPFGKIHRIDPLADGDLPYTVPSDNPFVGDVGESIWSFGLRNPWRFSFDPVTGDLWIADVGQNELEEIDLAPATNGLNAGRGSNFGWSAFEGTDQFNEDQPTDNHTPPVYEYRHDENRCSVSGGVRYRGETIRDLAGWYVFGDFCTGEIWALDPTAPIEEPRVIDLGQLSGLASIAQGPERELYAISNAGTVARFTAAA
jgi:glucose/arabinose dehydrogenase